MSKLNISVYDYVIQRNAEHLINEWDVDKNDNSIRETEYNSKKKAWWKCGKGHSWNSQIYSRVKGAGCPICSKSTSLLEIAIYLTLNNHFKSVKQKYKVNNVEYDIYVEDINLLIEYDGYMWHKNKREKDRNKNKVARNNGYNFIRIYEWDVKRANVDLILLSRDILYINAKDTKKIDRLCKYVNQYIFNEYNLSERIPLLSDVEHKAIAYRDMMELENSLYNKFPELMKEWDYKKNEGLNPKIFSPYSDYKVWWLCEKGHSWDAVIHNRTRGKGCPICNNKTVLEGFNDFGTWCKENNKENLLLEWDYEKNQKYKPENVAKNFTTKIWWICPNNHSYEATTSNRIAGKNCPYCSGQKLLKGFNDLATTCPEAIKYWDFNKNNKTPEDVMMGSREKVWWIINGKSVERQLCNMTLAIRRNVKLRA